MRRYFFCFFLVPLVACRQKSAPSEDRESPSASMSSAARAPALRPPRPVAAEAAPVPVEEDFEESVEREISAKNVEQELDKLERELKNP